jgi:radical SAM-linked protein
MFHRSVRRSGLPFVFSQGFNPHPIMTVAVPLSVGVTADGEYMRVGFDTDKSDEEIKQILNDALPVGFFVSAVKLCEGKQPDFNLIERAEYIIDAKCENPQEFSAEKLMDFAELVVMKKTKSGEKETDIRGLIYEIEKTEPQSGSLGIRLVCAAGNAATLKPETVIAAINKYMPNVKIGFFMQHRKALLDKDGNELL